MQRNLYISTVYAKEALKDKSSLGAMAFALLIKLRHVNSVVYDGRVRQMAVHFGIGANKVCRLVKDALRYGYIIKSGDGYMATELRSEANYCVRWKIKKRHAYTLKEAEDIIRKVVVLNHINMISDAERTATTATEPVSVKQYRKAQAKLKRMKKPFATESHYKTFSIDRAQQVMRTYRSEAVRLLRELVKAGLLIKEEQIEKRAKHIYEGVSEATVNYWHRMFGGMGYVFFKDNVVYCRYANIYKPSRLHSVVCYVKGGREL